MTNEILLEVVEVCLVIKLLVVVVVVDGFVGVEVKLLRPSRPECYLYLDTYLSSPVHYTNIKCARWNISQTFGLNL